MILYFCHTMLTSLNTLQISSNLSEIQIYLVI